MAKNKKANSDYSIFYITGGDISGVDIITMQYSNAGNLTAFDGYSDTVLARAGGGGYCKRSHALANALSKKYWQDFQGQGAGIPAVIEGAKKLGYTVYDHVAVSYLIYKTSKK